MFKSIHLLIFIETFFIRIYSFNCPEKQVVFPCFCTQVNQSLPDITCSRNDYNMSEIISNIRLNGHKDVEQSFGKLFWTNGKQLNITNDFFNGVSFQHLYIGTRRQYANISHISADAFRGISHKIKSIVIRSKYLRDEHNLFNALSKLTIVESIAIEGSHIRVVPKNAFKTPDTCYPLSDCVQNRLKTLSFRFGTNESLVFLTEIESYAFSDLPNLTSLDLSSHDISSIHKNAFTFGHKSEQILEINLRTQWDKWLVSDSFDELAFDGTNRPVLLDLYGNKFLTTLSEQVFRPLLESDSRNRIKLGMKMKCDCSLYWLWNQKQNFQKQFIEWTYDDLPQTDNKYTIQCSEGEENFWNRKESDFRDCETVLKNTEL